jgi:purine-binding chemotaxis protein CheW
MEAGEARQLVQESQRLGGKYLTFALGKEEYGIAILKVREIIGLLEITAVPHTPGHIKGVINLRGRVIPVLDLRIKFGMPEKEYDERTCIIVVEFHGPGGNVQIGMLVDSVSEVLNIGEEEIEPPPALGDSTAASNIMGMAKIKNKVKILLDINRVIGNMNLEQLSEL